LPAEATLLSKSTLFVEPPSTVSAVAQPSSDYLQGYRDAVNDLIDFLGPTSIDANQNAHVCERRSEFEDDLRGTWGLHATGVLNSTHTGQGVRVAALVDGLDLSHPDWINRHVEMRSFVPGEEANVGGASGTHYLGTALGISQPSMGMRYGCAPDAIPFVAKVLNQNGSGSLAAILAGIEWAVSEQCRVILIPLGWGGASPDVTFEMLAKRAATRGALLIAGAGLTARRSQGDFGSVGNPAACSSVVGVGSVDRRLQLPDWTPRSAAPPGAQIDMVAPAVQLRSSVPRPQFYDQWSGSATAAAFAAGIAALWAQAMPDASVEELRQAIVTHSRHLDLHPSDVGAGLIQAP
jgi:subtilisin family serine protease